MRKPMTSKTLAALAAMMLGVHSAHAADIEIDLFPVNSKWEILDPFGFSESVSLTGPAKQSVFFETSFGDALDDDSNGLDEVSTELTALNLTGTSTLFGAVSVSLNSALTSVGQLEEQINNNAGTLDISPFTSTGTALAFFDLYINLSLGSLTLSNVDPIRVSGLTSHKPATAEEYAFMFGNFSSTVFTDPNGNNYVVSGQGAASIPEPTTPLLLGLGVIGLAAMRRKRRV